VLQGHVARGIAPGLVSVIARRGDVHVDVIGNSALQGGHELKEDSIFRISSMTKPITAVATLILIEECVLRLDNSVEGLLPELVDRRVVRRIDGPVDDTVAALRPITVRDLLTFRMGFGAYFGPCPVNDAAAPLALSVGPTEPSLAPEPDEWMRRLSTRPLMCQPGERWLYHTGADVLGVLIARTTGVPFAEFLRERVFAPLGMKDTGFFAPANDVERLVTATAPTSRQVNSASTTNPRDNGAPCRRFPREGPGSCPRQVTISPSPR
jgi:CubicO group peptidase (beta-lactamase class C family)